MEIEHGGDSGDDAMPEDSVELEAAGSGSVLMVDLPIAALQDSCVGSDDARRDETPSSTPLFACILRSVLLQPQSDDSAAAQVAGLSGGGNTNKIIDDMKVFRVLNRLLSADEVLARRTDATNPRAFLTGEISTGGVIRGGSNGAGAKPPPGLSGAASRNMGLLEGSERQGDGEVGATGAGVEAAAAAMTAAATTKAAVAGTGEEVEVHLTSMLRRAPRRVCQYAFRKNDIVWICKVCQADETCVLCNDCFRSSDHKGHEVYFYHAQAGGCCDCGDPDAWDSRGFCPKHGLDSRDPMQELPKGLITSGLKVMAGVKEFLLDLARDVLQSFNLGAPWNQEGMPESIVVVLHQANISVELSSPLREIAKLDEGRMNEVLRSLREEKEEADLVTARGGGQAIRDTLEMARRLGEKGLLVSVRTLQLMERMGRALRVVRWLHKVSTLCDGTCRLVCEMLDVGTLVTLMEVDAKLPKELACKFHDLYLTLMADQPFKTRIAAAYTRALPAVTSNYARGVGTTDYGLYTLSVQFLNRSAFVKELVEKHFLLEILAECLFATLAPACEGPPTFPGERGNHVLNAKHSVMKHRRYMPIVNDLKCVLNIEGVPQRFLRVCFGDWTKIFTIVQEMAPQKRQQRTHVEYETRDWMYAFNINISLTLLFECMLSWLREPLGDASIPSGFFSRLSASGGDGDQRTEGAEGERQGHVGDRREVRENAGPSVTGNKILGARGAFEPPGIVPRALFDLPESAFSPSWIVGDGIGAAATGLGAPSPQGLFLRTFRELVRWYFARERNLASREAPRKLLVASFSTPTRRSTTPLPRHAAAAAPGRLGGRLVGKAGFPAHAVRLPRNPTNPGGSGPDLMDDGTGRSGGQMGIGEAGREVEESKERHDEEEDTAVPATQGTARPSGVVPESFVDLAQSVSDFVRSEREATMRVLKDVAQRREEAVGAAATESSTVPVPALGVVTFDEPSTDDAETAMAISPRGANAASSSAPVADAGETGVTAGSNTEGANFAEKEDPDSGGGASDYSRAWGARSRGGKAPTSRRAFDVARNPGSHAGAASGSRPGSFWDGGGAPSPAMWEWSALPTFPRGALPLRPVPPNRSFHIITHRFFAATIREACRCQEREGDLADLVECVSGHREVATDMEDVALLVLAFAAEIRAGLWKKNGQCMTDQVLNYAEMPFGKIFRDLDLLLAQFTALCCGADQLVNHILHRFQCFYWLFDEYDPPIISSTWRRLSRSSTRESVTERTGTVGGAATSSASVIPGRDVSDVGSRGGGSRGSRAGAVQGNTSADASRASSVPFGQGGSGSRGPVGSLAEHEAWTAAKAARESDGWLRRLRRKSLLDTEQQLALGEECLLLLILLVTEMPLPPDSTGASKSVERTADAADRPASSGRRSRSVANSGGGSMFGGCGTWGGSRPGGRGCNGKDAAQKPSLNSRVARQLRRELVHRLACAPCTHSELQETCQTTSQGEAFESELMEDILKEIADRREPSNALEPGKFVLKPEIFSVEYDCTFFHLSLQSHQLASERRPPVKGPTALAPPPPEAHSLFRRLRVDILVGAPTIRVVGQVLLGCVRKTAGRSRDTLLLRALHILTLAVHVCGGEPSVREPRPGESAAEAFSSEGNSDALCGVLMEPLVRPPAPPVTCGLGGSDADLGSNLHRQRDLWGELDQLSGPTTTFPGSLFAWTPFELPLSSPATRAAAEANAARAAPRPPPAPSATSAAAEEDGEKSPSSPVSVLELLLELKASSWARSDKTIAAGMDWLLERLAEMSEACRSFVESRTATASAAAGAGNGSSGGGGGKSGRNDAAAARKRMMEDIKKKADKFLRDFSMMAPDEDEDDDTEEEAIAARGTGAGGDSRADLGEPRWTEEQQKPDGEDSDPIPGVSSPGKAETRGESGAETRRRSSGKKSGAKRTGSRRGESLPTCIVCREVTDGALGYVGFGQRSLVLDARHTGRPGVHLQFCGHALHYSCFDKYFITSVQASESFSNVALDIDKGEFHCPFCKAVGNLMVPALIRDTPGESPPAPPITAAAAAAAAAASKGRDHGVRWTFGQESRGDGWLETKVAAALEAAISREGAARDGDTPSASSERPMTPDVKGFLEAIREVESSASKRAPDPTPDELFLSACRSLAYSVAASAAGNSPLQALRGDAVSRGDGALAPEVDSGDVPRRRYLRQVALVLRRAAGQMGIGDMVRRKLVALLRGDEVDVLRASAERGAPAVTVPGSVMDAASAGSNQEETASIQQMVASSILRGLRGGSQTPMPSTPRGSVSAEEEGKSRGWDVRQGLTGGGGGDLDQPLLSGGAMEMLAMALVVLPEGNFESAKHCVGSFCLVRVLQVLSSPSFANPKLFVPCDSLAAATVPGVERHDGMEEDDAHGKPVSTARLAELTSMFLQERRTAKATARATATATGGELQGGSRDRANRSGIASSGTNSEPESPSTRPSSDSGAMAVDEEDASNPFETPEATVPRSCAAPDLAKRLREKRLQLRTPGTDEALRGQSEREGSGEKDQYYLRVGSHVAAFLRASLLLLHVCTASEEDQREDGAGRGAGGLPELPATETYPDLCRYFGFAETAEEFLADSGAVRAACRWLDCVDGTVTGRWARGSDPGALQPGIWPTLMIRRRLIARRLFDFPSPVKIDLVPLPHAYTELHAVVSASIRSRTVHPAVCLVCGLVLEANGKGECTKHAKTCGSGVGIIFLLQECQVLLIHGKRASYFPSPYVDAYGERHRAARGRPLFLDARRYEVVRGLWARHQVAHEVVLNRSSSRQVIINDFY